MGQEFIIAIWARPLFPLTLILAAACWWHSPAPAQPELQPYTIVAETDPVELLKLLAAGDEKQRAETIRRLFQINLPGFHDQLLGIAQDPRSDLRVAAALALAYRRDKRVYDLLLAALREEDPALRRAAIEGLGVLRDPRSLEPLLAVAADPHSGVFDACVKTLGQFDDPRVSDIMLAAIRGNNLAARREAANALSSTPDIRALEPLLAAATDDDAVLRANVLRALASYPDPRTRQTLIRGLADADTEARISAAHAISQAVRSTYDVRIWGDAVHPLIGCLQDADAAVREYAATVLGQLNDPQAVEPLCRCLRPDDVPLMNDAVRSLRQLRDPRSVEPLLAALENPDIVNKYQITGTLNVFGDARAVEAYVRMLDSPAEETYRAAIYALDSLGRRGQSILADALQKAADTTIRRAIAWALAGSGDPRAIEPLLDTARQQEDADLRIEAFMALVKFPHDPRVQKLVREGLADPDPDVRAEFSSHLRYGNQAFALMLLDTFPQQSKEDRLDFLESLRYDHDNLTPPGVLEKLIDLRDDPDADTRMTLLGAISAVGSGDQHVLDVLAEYTRDPEPAVRAEAVYILAEWYLPHLELREQVYTLIANLLEDEDVGVRRKAVTALGRTDEEKALEPLLAAARDEKAGIRLNAAYALGKFGDDRAVEPLMEMAGDWHEGPRRAAKRALSTLGEGRAVPALLRVGLRELSAGYRSEKARTNLADTVAALQTLNGVGPEERKVRRWRRQGQSHEELQWLLSEINAREPIGQEAVKRLQEPENYVRLLEIVQHKAPDTLFARQERQQLRQAIRTLGQLGDPRAIEPLIALFTRSTRTDICGETIRVLASFDDPRVVQPLLTVLHGARYDASLCARALDKFDDPRILPEFSRIFRQEVKITDLKSTVASLLARRGDPEAFAYLLTRINNTDPIFSNYMLLGQTGDARALEPLLEAATKPDSYGNVAIRGLQALMELNPDPEVQQRGGTALLSLLGKAKYHSDFMILKPLITGKDPRAIEPLLRIFETGAWSSEQTAEALAEIGGPRVLDAFLDRLQAGPIPQRAVAARMLGRLDDPRVTPALAAAVRLGPTPVRLQAAESLGRLKARDAIEPLINVLGKDSSFRVRTAAATALAEITGQAFGVNAAQWREWWAGLHG